MAGVFPLVPPRTGSINGKLEVQMERFVTLDDLTTHLPETTSFLSELEKKGWRYLFIDGCGIVMLEVDVTKSPYTFQVSEHPNGGFAYELDLKFGRRLPDIKIKNIIELKRFVINISGNYHPRAVTIDILNNKVTYVHDSLWLLKGEGCKEEAKDVLRIVKWLIEEKKFKLGTGENRKYQELKKLIGD